MKIVESIPSVHEIATISAKRFAEIKLFMRSGAKYAELNRHGVSVDADIAGYKYCAKELGASVKLYRRKQKVYIERLESGEE